MRLSTFTIAAALTIGLSAYAGGGKEGPRGGHGPMTDHLLPPRVVDDLNLTADQKAKLSELESSFKKDAEKWKSQHAQIPEEFRRAKEAGDKEALRKLGEDRKELTQIRKSYVDKFRASLTEEQKAKLDKAREEMKERRGKGPGGEHAPKPPED